MSLNKVEVYYSLDDTSGSEKPFVTNSLIPEVGKQNQIRVSVVFFIIVRD